MNWFAFTTGYSFLDVWAIVHLAFWVFVGSTFWALHVSRSVSVGCGLLFAFAWEIFEYFMAPTHPEIWKDPESWWNAWISDPLMCAIGVLGIWWLLDRRTRRPRP